MFASIQKILQNFIIWYAVKDMLCDTISHKLLSPMIDMVENYYHDLLLHLTNIQQFELQTKLIKVIFF